LASSVAAWVVLGLLASSGAFAAGKIPVPKVKPPVPPVAQPQAPDADTAEAPAPAPAAPGDKPTPKQTMKSSHETNLPLPRFASMRKGEAYVRVGPGTRFPIDWVFTRKDMPIEILAENDVWRQIRDWEGTVGWVLSSQLAGRRMVIVKGEVGTLRNDPSTTADPVAHIEPGVIGRLIECPVPGDWCRIEVNDIRGWIHRGEVFGVYPTEQYPAP
jgi:SH3-like domain-containing protein